MKQNAFFYIALLFLFFVEDVDGVYAQQSKQYAIYNYRNDGDFNAFLNVNVDSITYSNIDTLGVVCDDIVVQEVWTPDSVYRIPIDAVDSIAFQTPKTIFKNDVYILRESHIPYTQFVDSLTIVFDSSIPSDMLPLVGQVLVSETFDAPYQDGFVGRVSEIKNTGSTITVNCIDATLTDIYEQLVAVGTLIAEKGSNDSRARHSVPKKLFGLDDINSSGVETFEIGELTISHDEFPELSVKYTPEFGIEYIIYIQKNEPIHLKLVLSGKHEFKLNVNLFKGKREDSPNKDSEDDTERGQKWLVDVPLPYFYGFQPVFKLGLYYKIGGSVSLTGTLPVTIDHSLGVEYHGEGIDISNVNIIKSFNMDIGEPDMNLKVEGHIAGGLAADLGVKFLHRKIASIDAILNMGPKLTTSFSLSEADWLKNKSWYSVFKNTKIKAEFDIGIEAKYEILTHKAEIVPGKGWPGVKSINKKEKGPYNLGYEWSWDLFECYLLPTFSGHTLTNYGDQRATYSTTTSNELFIPVKLGVVTEDQEGKTKEYWQDGKYRGEIDKWASPFETIVEDIKTDTMLTIKPVVELLGMKFPADPVATLQTRELILERDQEVEFDAVIVRPSWWNSQYEGKIKIFNSNDEIVKCEYNEKSGKLTIKGLSLGSAVVRIYFEDFEDYDANLVFNIIVSDQEPVDSNISIEDLPGEDL